MWMNEFEPDYHVSPCVTLRSVLRERGLTSIALARAGGFDLHTAHGLITGGIAITQPIAEKLEHVTGVPWRFWLQRQIDYEEGRDDDAR